MTPMNIFFLDSHPVQAARWQCDKHVVKMPLESAQMLSTAQRRYWPKEHCDMLNLYKEAYTKHPCTIWAGASRDNYEWLLRHFRALCDEYKHRFNRVHKCSLLLPALSILPPFESQNWQEPPQAMPDAVRVPGDFVSAYRNYYIQCKQKIAYWRKDPTRRPDWFKETP